ncbi:AfsR/SARP family transcriptional regulator [Actinosynnema pretiosum subsp. pretiosum]|uniref:AfsR/SARP family transcriptional regulator n=1 Tax=Actinosynnema pretiosum subsp. pretiosum TaxID=103721 RepID=A0AA45L8C3_9PSEU|nr:AfsR/SARP family transcriptional regulator [Actinosynnema pretiosum subsp. pretiosum]
MDGSAGVRVVLLGAFRVRRDDVALDVPGARVRALLVRLALAGGRAVEPGALVDAIWGDEPPAGPGPALQALVSRLRRALGAPGAVALGVGGYRLVADVDAARFEELAARGGEDALREAAALWGGRVGGEPPVVAAVAPRVATRLARLSVEVVLDLAEVELALGRTGAAIGGASGVLAEHPAHERAAGVLVDALAGAGRQAEALAAYERVRAALADELGADPGTALRERHLRLLRATPPPLPRPNALPAPVTGFLGRDADLARVADLLAAGRLVTVVGPGGVGKTRLAVEALRRDRDALLVDLAPVAEPSEVVAAVLAGIGLRGDRDRPGGDATALLAAELAARRSVLLLDNCEHLVDAVAHLVALLLPRCPELRVLATSREPLAVDGEALVPLGPLALPGIGDGLDAAVGTASVRLFAQRASAVRPGFAVDATTLPDVVRLVRALDGLPLALELAAARLRALPLPDLVAGLSARFRLLAGGNRAAPPRHRTLRAVIAWSWDLLDGPERAVAERISVLPGGVTPESAAAVCAGAVPADEVPELLAALVDRSLLSLVGGRRRMLETVRAYGVERLAAAGDLSAVRDLAAAHVAGVLAGQDAVLRGPGQRAAVAAIGAEHDNAVAALHHRCATGDADGALALALSLVWYWQVFGRQSEGAHWLGRALAVPGGPSPERDCARAAHLLGLADGGHGVGDRGEVGALADRVLAHRGLPGHLRVLGAVLLFLLGRGEGVFRELGAGGGWLSGLAHLFLAELAENAGELDRARGHAEVSLDRFRAAGDGWGVAGVLPVRARARRYDDLDGTWADLREARALEGEFGALSPGDRVRADLRWVDLHERRGDSGAALEVLAAARARGEQVAVVDAREAALRVRLGDLGRAGELLAGVGGAVGDLARAAYRVASGDLAGAERALRRARVVAAASGELPALAPVAVGAAALEQARGRWAGSGVLLGTAARVRGAHDRTDPLVRELVDRGRAAVGGSAFAAAYARGWEAERDVAAAFVL